MDASPWVVVAAAVAMAIGVVGTVVPLLPGLLLIVATAAVYGVIEGFGVVGIVAMMVICALAIAGTIAGVVLPGRAAGSAGAPRTSLFIGLVGAVVGFFVLPVVGVPVGGTLGIFVGEYARTTDAHEAWRTTKATLKGFGVSALVQLIAALIMVATWIVWVVAA